MAGGISFAALALVALVICGWRYGIIAVLVIGVSAVTLAGGFLMVADVLGGLGHAAEGVANSFDGMGR